MKVMLNKGTVTIVLSLVEAKEVHDGIVDAALAESNNVDGLQAYRLGLFAKADLLAAVLTKPVNTFAEKVIKARIPCAYGAKSCDGIRFAPNGVGSRQHTTCKGGRAAMAR